MEGEAEVEGAQGEPEDRSVMLEEEQVEQEDSPGKADHDGVPPDHGCPEEIKEVCTGYVFFLGLRHDHLLDNTVDPHDPLYDFPAAGVRIGAGGMSRSRIHISQ